MNRDSLFALLASCTTFGAAAVDVVPENLRAPPSQWMLLEAKATGVQIYECSPGKTDASRFEWAFKAPEADLFDGKGVKVGKHYGGPTWESNDGSKVVGEVKARSDSTDANAIPWLLLNAKSTSGAGVFTKTQSIQRLETSGGKAPASGCDQAKAGKEARVPYKATYYFYGPKAN
jgi:hypothetical protein